MSPVSGESGASWPAGTASAVGSMPGTDVREALRLVVGELPHLVPLPELPARGAGADLIGRTAAAMPELALDAVPTGWRVAARRGTDLRRAASWLAEDLDALEELAIDSAGPVKLALAGPLTLAASIELGSGERLLRDHGAVRDVAAELAEGVRNHLAAVARRLPGRPLVLQLDEPALPAVLAARVPTASGFATLRAVDAAVAEQLIRGVLTAASDAGALPVVHCCAADLPVELLLRAGARGLSFDAALLDPRLDELVGGAVESGVALLAGLVPTDGSELSDPTGTVAPVRRLWHRLGFDPAALASSVVVTPACGLAGVSWPAARAALTRCREAARVLVEDPEAPQ